MHQPTPPGSGDPPPNGPPPGGFPPKPEGEALARETSTLTPAAGANPGVVLANRFWLFAGPILTEDMPEEMIDEIEEVGVHGFYSFHGANADLDKLIMAARERFDVDDTWWHIVDVVYTKVVWDSDDDRMQRH